jgi:uncharacterized protein (DUF488 family)
MALIRAQGIEQLLDVRTLPGSKRFPHFNSENLSRALDREGIAYQHMPGLGGLRKPRKDSTNLGWRNASFRGFADYMQTEAFEENLEKLMGLARETRSVLLCAEAVPWRCHRSLIADALKARGWEVRHIIGSSAPKEHEFTPFAHVKNGKVVYPRPEK